MKGRQRGRNNNGGKPRMHQGGGGGGGGRNPNFDHNAGRMRGNAQQLMDKFLALARDASSQGDRVLAENYFQHADHYYRVINARFEGQQNQQRRFNNGQSNQDRGGYEGQDSQGNYQDYNSGPDVPPGPSQNLIPSAPTSDAQPHLQAQPQPSYEQQQYQPPQQQQPQQHDDGDIGLPPQLFGNDAAPQRAELPDTHAEPQGNGGGEQRERGGRPPRQGTRRRFGPRREGQARQPAEPVDA